MAEIKIEIEINDFELDNLMIAKKMAEDDCNMKLNFSNFFRVVTMNYIRNRPIKNVKQISHQNH